MRYFQNFVLVNSCFLPVEKKEQFVCHLFYPQIIHKFQAVQNNALTGLYMLLSFLARPIGRVINKSLKG